ncbi:hypothetical protein ACLKMH_10205 [Psychromonas sp. KJ10-10]
MKLIPIKHAKIYVAVMVAISQQVMASRDSTRGVCCCMGNECCQ